MDGAGTKLSCTYKHAEKHVVAVLFLLHGQKAQPSSDHGPCERTLADIMQLSHAFRPKP